MANICFLLLCHKNPEQIVQQVSLLARNGNFVAIHFDGRSKMSDFKMLSSALADNPNVCFANRVKCGWGEWSLVQATLNTLKAGYDNFPHASHFYMLSGDCAPIKPISYINHFLDADDKDYIEHNDFFESNWIKVGMKEARLVYRHWFNERTNKTLFYFSAGIQKRLGLKRTLPDNLHIMIGSQWWCLRRQTIKKLFNLLKARPDIVRFFRTTWIPDETFFQTLVLHIVPRNEVISRTLTFLSFSDYGLPTVFYRDHFDFLVSQNYLFARKISPNAEDLKNQLAEVFESDNPIETAPDGRKVISYLNTRGRMGMRFGERFWERGSRIGRQNTLQVILCKKWHVGKRFADAISKNSRVKSVGYLFDEDGSNLPDLGQLEQSHLKRNRHRRAFLKLLYERLDTDQLIVCMDPSNLETLSDFANDRCSLRVLDVQCHFDDSYLIGHAQRIGLADNNIKPDSAHNLISALQNNIKADHEALIELHLSELYSVSENGDPDTNTVALAGFMKASQQRAEKLINNLSFD